MPAGLIEYVKSNMAQGIPKATIEVNLFQAGWKKEQIDKAFQELTAPVEVIKSIPQEQSIKPVSSTLANQQNSQSGESMKYANLFLRWVAYLIDVFLLVILYVFLSIFLDIFLNTSISGTFALVIDLAIACGYFVVYQSLTGQTIGKRFMGVKVVNENGETPTMSVFFIREIIGKQLSTLTLMIGHIVALFDSRKQTLHDKIANTFVISVVQVKTELNPLIILITLILSLITVVIGFFLGGLILLFFILFGSHLAPPALSHSIVVISNIVFYSFLLIFGFSPLIWYLSRKFKLLIPLQIILFSLIVGGTILFTVPKAFIEYNKGNYESINDPISIAVIDNILLIEDKGELFSEGEKISGLYPEIRKPSEIWSYQIPDGQFIEVNTINNTKGKEQKTLLDKETKKWQREREKYQYSENRITVTNSSGSKRYFQIRDGNIQETGDELGNKPIEIPIENKARILWSKNDFIFIQAEGEKVNQIIIYKLNINNLEISKLDSVEIESDKRMFGNLHQGYLYQDEIVLDEGTMVGHALIFNLKNEKFTLNLQIPGEYFWFYNYNENYCFLYGKDGVVMVDKNTNKIVNNFKGK